MDPNMQDAGGLVACPLCGVQLAASEVEAHYQLELQGVRQQLAPQAGAHSTVAGEGKKRDRRGAALHARKKLHAQATLKDSDGVEAAKAVLEKVRKNRKERGEGGRKRPKEDWTNNLSDQTASPKGTPLSDGSQPTCPVCGCHLPADEFASMAHINACLDSTGSPQSRSTSGRGRGRKRQKSAPPEEDNGFETYTWAGQTRVRAVTMLESGWQGAGFQTTTKGGLEEEDLDIEADESSHYGQAQYSELDTVPCDQVDASDTLRSIMAEASGPTQRNTSSPHLPDEQGNASGAAAVSQSEGVEPAASEHGPEGSEHRQDGGDRAAALVIASLKATIVDLQQQVQEGGRQHCLVCLGPYVKPVVSVKCWHVHCEDCWLQTLGAKKLCPQCTIITVPGDLRRIYL